MSRTLSLFETQAGHDGAPPRIVPAVDRATGPAADRPPDDRAANASPALPGLSREHAKADARRAVRAIQAGTLGGRLLALYRRCATPERLPWGPHRLDALTDWEAAALLGVERTSINAARAALVASHGVGRVGPKRRCHHRPRRAVNAWGLPSAGLPSAGLPPNPDAP